MGKLLAEIEFICCHDSQVVLFLVITNFSPSFVLLEPLILPWCVGCVRLESLSPQGPAIELE